MKINCFTSKYGVQHAISLCLEQVISDSNALIDGMLSATVSNICLVLSNNNYLFLKILKLYNYWKDCQEMDKTDIPDPNKLLTEYSMAYENGLSKLQQQAQANLMWFTCKVMPAVQKNTNHFV